MIIRNDHLASLNHSLKLDRISRESDVGTPLSSPRYGLGLTTSKEFSMCDYSLHLVSSRPAEAGEIIVVTGFSGTDTRGFASPLDPGTAVCLRPGTEIVFDQCARLDGRLFRRNINERLARFRQIDMDRPNLHHDSLEFANGRVVLVTSLVMGQRAQVLQLPAGDREKPALERAAEPTPV